MKPIVLSVIPDTAHIEGTIRYFKDGDAEKAIAKINELCKILAELHHTEINVSYAVAAKYPVINDEISTKRAINAAKAVGFIESDAEPSAGSDNFAEFQYAFGGCYCNMGSKSTREGSSEKHHTSTFDLDETVLPKCVAFLLQYVDDFMNENKRSDIL